MSGSLEGPLPDWLDPESTGLLFNDALGIMFDNAISYDVPGQKSSVSDLPGNPDVSSLWWNPKDHFTPKLLRSLLDGQVAAFGVSSCAGETRWISAQEWYDLQPVSDIANSFGTGNKHYRDVRVVWGVHIVRLREIQKQPIIDEGIVLDGLLFCAGRNRSRAGNRPRFLAGPAGQVSGEQIGTINNIPGSKQDRNTGGRPLREGHIPFVIELIRAANQPDGLPERTQLRKYMKHWCSTTFGDDAPADGTIDNWIDKFVPWLR